METIPLSFVTSMTTEPMAAPLSSTQATEVIPPNDSHAVHVVAKVAWFAPALLLLLAINQVLVSVDILDTLRNGDRATATVTEYERVDRADVTFGYVSLAVDMGDGTTLTKEKMSLPYTLLPRLEGETELPVIINPGADQEIVIEEIASTQWKIAAIQSSMALLGSLMIAVGVYAWNRHLGSTVS